MRSAGTLEYGVAEHDGKQQRRIFIAGSSLGMTTFYLLEETHAVQNTEVQLIAAPHLAKHCA